MVTDEKVLELHAAGCTIKQIAAACGSNKNTVLYKLRKHGRKPNRLLLYGRSITFDKREFYKTVDGHYKTSTGEYLHREVWKAHGNPLVKGEHLYYDKNDPLNVGKMFLSKRNIIKVNPASAGVPLR